MTQQELQERLGKSLKTAIRKYLKDGGKLPKARVGEVVSVVDDDGELWTLDVSYGSVNDPGSIFIGEI